eukprot:424198_1
MDDSTPSPMSTSTSPSNSDFLMSSSEEHLNGSAGNVMRHSAGCWLIYLLPGGSSKLKRRILKDIIFDENILRNLYESDNLPSDVSSLEKVSATLCDIYDDSIQVDPGFVISDWLLSPFENINATPTQTNDSPTKLSRVKALLSLICILSKVGVTHEYFASLPAGLVLRSVMTVYLCGSGVFLDPEVKDLLERIIRPIVDGNLPVPLQMERSDSPSRLSSFLGMFSELVRIFCSESYGDETFARTVFHFTRNCYDSRFRDVVWEEAAVFASALENCAPDSLDQYVFETFPDDSIKCYVEFLTSTCLSP